MKGTALLMLWNMRIAIILIKEWNYRTTVKVNWWNRGRSTSSNTGAKTGQISQTRMRFSREGKEGRAPRPRGKLPARLLKKVRPLHRVRRSSASVPPPRSLSSLHFAMIHAAAVPRRGGGSSDQGSDWGRPSGREHARSTGGGGEGGMSRANRLGERVEFRFSNLRAVQVTRRFCGFPPSSRIAFCFSAVRARSCRRWFPSLERPQWGLVGPGIATRVSAILILG